MRRVSGKTLKDSGVEKETVSKKTDGTSSLLMELSVLSQELSIIAFLMWAMSSPDLSTPDETVTRNTALH